MRDVMSFPNRDIAVDFDMKIDIEAEPHFTHQTLVDSNNAFDRRRRFANAVDDFPTRRRVQNVVERRPQKPYPDSRDDKTDKNRRPIVRAAPFFAADQRDRNSNERRDRTEDISAMTPGVGFDRDTFSRTTEPDDVTKKRFFHCDDPQQDEQSKRRRL